MTSSQSTAAAIGSGGRDMAFAAPIPDEDLEWPMRLSLECRRRVKEQQKRIGSAEFRSTRFSYRLGEDGLELRGYARGSERRGDRRRPTPAGVGMGDQSWRARRGVGLYRIEVNEASGSGVKVINRPVPPSFSESLRCAEQNLVSRARETRGGCFRNPTRDRGRVIGSATVARPARKLRRPVGFAKRHTSGT
jgi:hypothetical protein